MIYIKALISLSKWLLPLLYLLQFHVLTAQYTLPEPLLFPFEGFHRIERLAQDDRGLLWLGTNRGLFCFDGSYFRRIQHSIDNTSAIDNGLINALLFDRHRDCLWIASSTGIHALDLQSETFTEVPYYRETASRGKVGECETIFQDREGVLWFGINEFGLIRMDRDSHRYFPVAGRTRGGRWNNQVSIAQIAQDATSDSILWLAAGLSASLVRFNTVNGKYQIIVDQSDRIDRRASGPLIVRLLPAREKIFLGNPWDRHGYMYDLITRQYRRIDYTTDHPVRGALAFLAPRSADTFWACNREELLLIDSHSGELLTHFPKPKEVQAFTEWMLVTPGRLWIGSDKGLLLYDLTSYRVQNHWFEPDEHNQPFYFGSALERGDASHLWVAFQASQYIYQYDRRTRETVQVPWLEKGTGPPKSLFSLQDGRELGLADHGFYELRDEKLIYLPLCEEQAAAQVGFSMAIQDSRGQVWIASRWGGLYKLDLETGHCEQCLDEQGRTEMRLIFRDRDDNIWVPYKGGFSVYYAKKERFFHFPFQAGREKTVRYPRGFAQDAAGNVWISDIVLGGLMRVDPTRLEEGIQERVIADNGPGSNQMRRLTADQSGRIWAVTNVGVQVFDPESKTFELYGESSGFRLRAPNPLFSNFIPSYIHGLSSGELLVGYTDGFAIFHPDSLGANPEKPRVYILDLINSGDTLVRSPHFGPLKKIRLPYNQNDLEIGFSTIAWREADKIRFRYRLSGLHGQWKETAQRRLHFANLAPGDYTFQLYGINSSDQKSAAPLTIPFKVLPPWWQSWWAYSLLFLLITAAAYAFYQYKKRQWELRARLDLEHREVERLKELDAVKTRLYTNITHEFRTPITVILGMAGQVRDKPEKWFREGLRMIISRGQELLRLVDQMLDLSKVKAGRLPVRHIQGNVIPFLRYLVTSFHAYAKSEGIELSFQTKTEVLSIDYDPEKMTTIVSNLLSNAIKYTPVGGEVTLTAGTEPAGEEVFSTAEPSARLTIVVKDTGQGIPLEQQAHIFDHFYQVESTYRSESPPGTTAHDSDPALRNGHARQNGTGIGLALTRELVKLLGGTIAVKSAPGKGSTFTVRLPITRMAAAPGTDLLPEIEMPVVASETATSEGTGGAAGQQPLLLIIEDDRDLVRYLGACLEEEYQLEIAFDGRRGMEKARELIPDIIISDVMMPEADGFEVCRTLKADRLTSHIPIVLLTAKADRDSRVEGLSYGADAYLAKPFHREELLVRLRKLIELRGQLQEYYRELPPSGRSQDEKTAIEDAFIREVRQILETHLGDEDFGVAEVCRAIGMSRAQLYRKFTALTGQGIARYFRSLRLQRGKTMIETTDLNISEIALEVGFKYPAYFSRAFREEFGCNPGGMRQ